MSYHKHASELMKSDPRRPRSKKKKKEQLD